MLKPTAKPILKSDSYYSLVMAVAKRARQIVVEAEEMNEILVEKPVQLAVEEFIAGTTRMVE